MGMPASGTLGSGAFMATPMRPPKRRSGKVRVESVRPESGTADGRDRSKAVGRLDLGSVDVMAVVATVFRLGSIWTW